MPGRLVITKHYKLKMKLSILRLHGLLWRAEGGTVHEYKRGASSHQPIYICRVQFSKQKTLELAFLWTSYIEVDNLKKAIKQ